MSSSDTKAIRDAYFNACNFESLMRGIHFSVFWIALVQIYTGKQSRHKHVMAALVIAMFIMSTVHNATYWAYVRRAFIAYGDTSETVAAALDEYPSWFTGTTAISDLNAVLADGILIWRAWVVWGRNWLVIVAPVATTILTLVFSIIATYGTVSSTSFGAVGVDYATALYSTSLITTILCTGLIVYKIVQVGGAQKGGLRSYRNIMEILVESAVLYCIATLFALLAYIYSSVASEYASAFWTSITGIAPTLIIARVAAGESRPEDTWMASTTSRFRSGSRYQHSDSTSISRPSFSGNELESFVAAVPMPMRSLAATDDTDMSSGTISLPSTMVSDRKRRISS